MAPKGNEVDKIRGACVTAAIADEPNKKALSGWIAIAPVVVDGKLTGMISLGDVVKEIISEQQFKIEQLEHTISWEESY